MGRKYLSMVKLWWRPLCDMHTNDIWQKIPFNMKLHLLLTFAIFVSNVSKTNAIFQFFFFL